MTKPRQIIHALKNAMTVMKPRDHVMVAAAFVNVSSFDLEDECPKVQMIDSKLRSMFKHCVRNPIQAKTTWIAAITAIHCTSRTLMDFVTGGMNAFAQVNVKNNSISRVDSILLANSQQKTFAST